MPLWLAITSSSLCPAAHSRAFLGPKVGVRTPPDMTEAAYTTARRAAEFRQGRAEGIVGATVGWPGEPADEMLEWLSSCPDRGGSRSRACSRPLQCSPCTAALSCSG
jgi:hypothetical protein